MDRNAEKEWQAATTGNGRPGRRSQDCMTDSRNNKGFGIGVSICDSVEPGDIMTHIQSRSCSVCGEPISQQRLEAIPRATHCIQCQERADLPPPDWHVSELECPRCGSRLVWRTARSPAISGYFRGCNRYPACTYLEAR